MWRSFMSTVERLLLVLVLFVGSVLPSKASIFLLIDVTFDTSIVLRDDIKSHLVLPLMEKVCYVIIKKEHFSAHLVLLLQCVDGQSAG
jgi:hypothetical protein